MSVHTEYVLKTIYYNKVAQDNLRLNRYDMFGDYGYPLKGLRSSYFPAFLQRTQQNFHIRL